RQGGACRHRGAASDGPARQDQGGKGPGRDHFGHNDPSIGALVADALEKVGGEGVISVEESKTTETSLDVVEGMKFDRGFLSLYFVTDAERMEAILEDAHILLCDHKISALNDLVPLLEQVAKSGRPLVIIAEDIEGDALATLIVNLRNRIAALAWIRAQACYVAKLRSCVAATSLAPNQ